MRLAHSWWRRQHWRRRKPGMQTGCSGRQNTTTSTGVSGSRRQTDSAARKVAPVVVVFAEGDLFLACRQLVLLLVNEQRLVCERLACNHVCVVHASAHQHCVFEFRRHFGQVRCWRVFFYVVDQLFDLRSGEVVLRLDLVYHSILIFIVRKLIFSFSKFIIIIISKISLSFHYDLIAQM